MYCVFSYENVVVILDRCPGTEDSTVADWLEIQKVYRSAEESQATASSSNRGREFPSTITGRAGADNRLEARQILIRVSVSLLTVVCHVHPIRSSYSPADRSRVSGKRFRGPTYQECQSHDIGQPLSRECYCESRFADERLDPC
jgi:hypothetical protein